MVGTHCRIPFLRSPSINDSRTALRIAASRTRPRLWPLTLLLTTLALPGLAQPILLQDTFSNDGDVRLIALNVTASQPVTIQSWGYAGGTVPTLPASTVVPSGGFVLNLVLFDDTGNQIASDHGGNCTVSNTDPVTGNCGDAWLQDNLATGTYTLALAEWDSVPVDGLLADGFTQQGNAGFTCAEVGQTGDFCDATTALYTSRTGNYAISIDGADVLSDSAVPEPSSLLLAAGAFGLLLCCRPIRSRNTTLNPKGNR